MTDTEHDSAPVRTKLAKQWVIRMVLIAVVLWAFGGWAFFDAAVKYPARGRLHAEGVQLEYLKTAQEVGRLFDAPVVDPAGELATLRELDVLEVSKFDGKKLEWLETLAIPGLGLLNPDHTLMNNDPAAELARLQEQLNTRDQVAGLSEYDILLQWAICAACWLLGSYLLGLFLVVKSRSYRWDASSNTLTLPGGTTIAPADLDPEDPADLSKWHKFIVFLRPKEGHEKLGDSVRLDLFRHEPLEDWTRLLVKGADADFEFPDEAKAREEAEAAEAEASAAESEPEPDEES
jgi:hypothetical protein